MRHKWRIDWTSKVPFGFTIKIITMKICERCNLQATEDDIKYGKLPPCKGQPKTEATK